MTWSRYTDKDIFSNELQVLIGENEKLYKRVQALTAEIERLKELLNKHNIPIPKEQKHGR